MRFAFPVVSSDSLGNSMSVLAGHGAYGLSTLTSP
jgi:hypothetical protein